MTKKTPTKAPSGPPKRPVGRPKAEPTFPISLRLNARQLEYWREIGGTRAMRRWLVGKAAEEGRNIA